jgi:hypothetical protein
MTHATPRDNKLIIFLCSRGVLPHRIAEALQVPLDDVLHLMSTSNCEQITQLHSQGVPTEDIAHKLGFSPRDVELYLINFLDSKGVPYEDIAEALQVPLDDAKRFSFLVRDVVNLAAVLVCVLHSQGVRFDAIAQLSRLPYTFVLDEISNFKAYISNVMNQSTPGRESH